MQETFSRNSKILTLEEFYKTSAEFLKILNLMCYLTPTHKEQPFGIIHAKVYSEISKNLENGYTFI